jgi:hypothetical protein
MSIPSSIISIIQVNEGLIKCFFTRISIPTKFSLNNVVAQTIVDWVVRRNHFFGNGKVIPKLMNNLFMLEKNIKMEQLQQQKKQL